MSTKHAVLTNYHNVGLRIFASEIWKQITLKTCVFQNLLVPRPTDVVLVPVPMARVPAVADTTFRVIFLTS